ncbi:MAG: CPBP family intramembrane glutamic endopeptidase [Gammaproteobacteria bacterium]
MLTGAWKCSTPRPEERAMTHALVPRRARLLLGGLLWFMGMAGAVSLTVVLLPQMQAQMPGAGSPGQLAAAALAQSGILLALAVATGTALGPAVGLGAPAISAALAGASTWPALRRQCGPALIGGLAVAALLVMLTRIAPAELRHLGTSYELPLVVKLLYGGVTEELLVRWGLMTFLVWAPWRLCGARSQGPRATWFVLGITLSALLFGAGHLPTVVALGSSLSAVVVVHVLFGNGLAGVVFGTLFWRWGLESAIVAHMLAHAVSSFALAVS